MIGTGQDGNFKTTATAAWPPRLCKLLSALTMFTIMGDYPENDKFPAVGASPGESRRPSTPSPPSPAPTRTTATTRRKITGAELKMVDDGRSDKLEGIYVGRRKGRGGSYSIWANPYRIDKDGDRGEVACKFKRLVESDPSKFDPKRLVGKVLLCHCRKEDACHADVLCELANRSAKMDKVKSMVLKVVEGKDHFRGNKDGDQVMMDFIDDGLPVRPLAHGPPLQRGVKEGQRQERRATFMGRSRSFEDGGGLCSQGRWRRDFRPPPQPMASRILTEARTLLTETVGAASGGEDGPLNFVLKLAAGRFEDSPFDEGALDKILTETTRSRGVSLSALGSLGPS